MPTLEELDKKLDTVADSVARVESALKYDGVGLIPSFQKHCEENQEFQRDYNKLKILVFTLIGAVAGLDIITNLIL